MSKNTHLVTIFQNIQDTTTPFFRPIEVILDRIKDGKSKEVIEKVRGYKDKSKRNETKKYLPAICFSGEFNTRKDTSIVSHSGIICLDFDDFPSEKILRQTRKKLEKDKYTFSLFLSPSGNGLKVLVKIPREVDNHKMYFLALEGYYKSSYFDRTCKNISRVCYESYDPDIYINEKSKLWNKISEDNYQHISVKDTTIGKTIKIDDQDEIVRRLMLWWTAKYGVIEGERNNNVFILAAAFNEFGVDKSLASYVMKQFQMSDFPVQEINATIDSAYRSVQNFNTKFFEDKGRVDSVRDKLRSGISKKEIRSQLIELGVEDDVADAVIKKKEEETNSLKFWSKNERGVVTIIHFMLKAFLQDRGYYRYYPAGGSNFIFIKINSNRVDNATEDVIKDEVLSYLEKMEDLSIYNHFADKTRYFKEDFLSMLDSQNVPFLKDTKDMSYIYYKNCAVKVTSKDVEAIEYENLGGFVWNDQIIKRDFDFCTADECDYKKFINNISSNDEGRIDSMRSTIGFLLHGYKNKGFCPAVIINDEVISDNPEGGTGKGLFVQGITELKKNIVINGKEFSFEKSFAYQLVSADTQVLTFDDVRKNFPFENLFSVITEGITLEKKNKDAIKIPYEESPKVVITTNYAIKGKGNSFERRKWELELTRHYHAGYTPYDEFGRLLFDEWDESEWCKFDNYMINNLQFYLQKGFVQSEFKNLNTRKFIAETSHEFYEWSTEPGNIETNLRIYKADIYNLFIMEYPDYTRKLSRKLFGKWVKSYALYIAQLPFNEGRDHMGRYFTITDDNSDSFEEIVDLL